MQHKIETPFGKPEFLVLAGSRLYGIDGPDSDYDYIGALVEPPEYVIGLRSHSGQHGFEQHRFSGDNFEGQIYGLRKLVGMFASGDPTSLCTLFADPIIDEFGLCTDEFRSMVLSAQSGKRFLKYMEAQRKSMINQRSKTAQRQDLIDTFGFDTKFAGHLIRLGYQGHEFLSTGKLTLPMKSNERTVVKAIRHGLWSEDAVIDLAEFLFSGLETLLAQTSLPDQPDWEAINKWVIKQYEVLWLHHTWLKELDN